MTNENRDIKKITPKLDNDSIRFWEGCKRRELLIQQCNHCEKSIFYPRVVCPHCMSDDIEWVKSKGKGKIYSYTISYRSAHPSFENDTPYVIALIDLDEGVRMLSNILNCDFKDLECETPVEVVFEDITTDITLPKFIITK